MNPRRKIIIEPVGPYFTAYTENGIRLLALLDSREAVMQELSLEESDVIDETEFGTVRKLIGRCLEGMGLAGDNNG